MPCGCEDEKKETAQLRFIGGRHKKGIERGPFLSYETGKIYEVPAENVFVPWWEAVDKEIIEEEEQIEEEEVATKSLGLTQRFTGDPPTEEDFFRDKSKRELRAYLESIGGKADGRWGEKKLIEEILKRQ